MQSNSILYSFKIWVTSVLVAPLLFIFITSLKGHDYPSGIGFAISQQISMYDIYVIFGGIFSICTWLVFTLVIKIATIYVSSIPDAKLLVVIAGVLLNVGTFAVFLPGTFNIHDDFFYLMLSNCLCIGLGSWFYKLELPTKTEVSTN